MATGLRIDDEMSMFDAIRLGWGDAGHRRPRRSTSTPPVTGDRNESGAVLILDEAAAQPILDQVR